MQSKLGFTTLILHLHICAMPCCTHKSCCTTELQSGWNSIAGADSVVLSATMVKSLSAHSSHWSRKQAIKWGGGGVCFVCVDSHVHLCFLCACMCFFPHVYLYVWWVRGSYFTFWSGGCLWGNAAPFEQQLYSQQSGHPRLALGGMLQRIWMLGTLPRVANECSLFWWGVYHLLTCWFVQVCVVWAM